MAEKKAESGGTKGQARQQEKAASATTGGNVRNSQAKTTTPLLDINHCTARQLSLIPGVSREVGDRIVATRRRLGGSFQYFDQLHTIKGVTRVVVQALRGRVQVPCEKATSIGEPEGYMRLGPVQSQSSLLSLNSLGDVARRKAEETTAAKQKKSPKVTPRPSYGGKKSRTPTKLVSTPPRKTIRNLAKTKTPTGSSKIHGKSTKTPATSRARSSNRQAAANRSVEGKSRLKSPRKPGKSPVSSKRPPTGRLVGKTKTKTPAKRPPAKKSGASASRSRSRTPKRATKKSSARAASASKPPRPSPRRKKAVSISPQTKKIKTTPRRAKATPRRESAVTYQVVTSPGGKSTWTYPSSRGRASTRQPPVLVLKIETSPTQQQTADAAPAETAVAASKTPQVEVEETSVSSGSRSRRSSKKSANKRTQEEPSVEVTPGDSASATAGSKTPAVPSTTAGANAPAVEVEKDPARLRSRSSVEAVEKWLESTARYSTDLPQQEQGDDCSSRHTRQGMEDITSEYKSAVAYPPSTASAERAKGTQPVQTDSQGWNVAEGNQTQPSPEEPPPAAKDAEGNDTQGNEKEPVVVEQVEAGAEVVGTPTGRERRRRHHRHRRSRDEPSPKRRRRSFDSGSYPTCSVL